MARADFEATWCPRIGKDAAEELRRARRTAWLGPFNAVSAVAAGVLIGTTPAGDAIGIALVVGLVVSFGIFVRAQWRTAAAISLWFGVKRMRWLPRMTPQRFDEWASPAWADDTGGASFCGSRRGLRLPSRAAVARGNCSFGLDRALWSSIKGRAPSGSARRGEAWWRRVGGPCRPRYSESLRAPRP